MVNSRGSSGRQLLETWNITDTDTSKTFTIPSTDFDLFTHITIEWAISVNGALTMGMQINGITTSTYYNDGIETVGGTTTIIDLGGADRAILCTATGLGADTKSQSGSTTIRRTMTGQDNSLGGISISQAPTLSLVLGWNQSNIAVPITSIKILVSTSSFEGGYISIYRHRR